jgi:hypothetical protein
MKGCKTCKEVKEDWDFYRNHDECKECWKAYCKARNQTPEGKEKRRQLVASWRERNPEKIKEYTKKSLEKNKEKINERRRTPERRKVCNESVKNWRKNNPEKFAESEKARRLKDRPKELARNYVYKQISKGKLERPSTCERCFKECKPEAHHDDYTKPLLIKWLCKICHRQEHGKLLDVCP